MLKYTITETWTKSVDFIRKSLAEASLEPSRTSTMDIPSTHHPLRLHHHPQLGRGNELNPYGGLTFLVIVKGN